MLYTLLKLVLCSNSPPFKGGVPAVAGGVVEFIISAIVGVLTNDLQLIVKISVWWGYQPGRGGVVGKVIKWLQW